MGRSWVERSGLRRADRGVCWRPGSPVLCGSQQPARRPAIGAPAHPNAVWRRFPVFGCPSRDRPRHRSLSSRPVGFAQIRSSTRAYSSSSKTAVGIVRSNAIQSGNCRSWMQRRHDRLYSCSSCPTSTELCRPRVNYIIHPEWSSQYGAMAESSAGSKQRTLIPNSSSVSELDAAEVIQEVVSRVMGNSHPALLPLFGICYVA